MKFRSIRSWSKSTKMMAESTRIKCRTSTSVSLLLRSSRSQLWTAAQSPVPQVAAQSLPAPRSSGAKMRCHAQHQPKTPRRRKEGKDWRKRKSSYWSASLRQIATGTTIFRKNWQPGSTFPEWRSTSGTMIVRGNNLKDRNRKSLQRCPQKMIINEFWQNALY